MDTDVNTAQPKNLRWFFVGEEGLRSGYRVVLFVALFIGATVVGAVVATGVEVLIQALGLPISEGERFLLLAGITYIPAFVLTIALGLLDKPRSTSNGMGGPALRSLGEYVAGSVIGGLLVLLTLIVPAIIGNVNIDAQAPGWHWLLIGVWFVGLAIAAAWEEVAFRGYGFQWLCRATGNVLFYAIQPFFSLDPSRVAQWLGRAFWISAFSILFGLMHASNANAGWLSGINTALAGVWLAIAVFRSRALWLAFGLHFGWNFAQGPILGMPISGIGSEKSGIVIPSLWKTTLYGPEWATGAGYGIEAGLPCTFVLFLAIAIAALWPARKPGEDAPVLRPGSMVSPV